MTAGTWDNVRGCKGEEEELVQKAGSFRSLAGAKRDATVPVCLLPNKLAREELAWPFHR